ncbi:MAG: HEAT repeat domain-containing protein [Planctomycetota bacterium]|jgi:hypothetical protein
MNRPSVIAAIALLALAGPVGAQAVDPAPAAEYFQELLVDPASSALELETLARLGDEDMLPLFVVMTRSKDKQIRLLGTALLGETGADKAAEPLQQRLESDPMMTIRHEALAQLIRLDTISVGQLLAATRVDDEAVRCLAARELARRKNGDIAAGVLKELTESSEMLTVCQARLGLLGLRDRKQLAPLAETIQDPDTNAALILPLLLQVKSEEITEALPLVRHVAGSDRPWSLRVLAYRVMSDLSPAATRELADSLEQVTAIVHRVQLLRLLAEQADAPPRLQKLASGDDPVAALARLELARLAGGPKAAKAAIAAIDLGHPVVVDYVLDVIGQDIDKRGAKVDHYTAALAHCIEKVPADSQALSREHMPAIKAAALLGDLGTERSLALLKQLLTSRYSTTVRAVAAGVQRSANPAVVDSIRPLLDSAYAELAAAAAITLGAHGHEEANPGLLAMINRPVRHPPATVALASWYLLKNTGQSRRTARNLAETIK